MTRRRLALAATALLATGACTSQEAAPPQNTAPTIPPVSSTTLPPETTVAEPAPDTTVAEPEPAPPETTTTTTLPPTTTIAAPSGVPTSSAVEYFAGGDPDGWLFVGRWTGTDWQAAVSDDGTAIDPTTSDGAEVSILELDVPTIDGTATGSADACPSGRVGPIISPNARAPEDPGFGYRALAFSADWDPRPRRIEVVNAVVPAYAAAGAAAFEGDDIDASGGEVSTIVVTDLDGDGDSESVVVYRGDGFSALLLIDAQTGSSLTLAASAQTSTIAPPAGDGEGSPAPVVTPNDEHRVLDVVDVNGDGLMEIVAHTFVDDGDASVEVYTYDGTDTDTVLTGSC